MCLFCKIINNEIINSKNKLNEIEENNECYTIKNLKVNGRDIMSLGYKNKEVGEVLNYLLEIVIEDYTLNKKDVLIKKIKIYIFNKKNHFLLNEIIIYFFLIL